MLRSNSGLGMASVLLAVALVSIATFTLVQISSSFLDDARRSHLHLAARNLERAVVMALASRPSSPASGDSLCQKLFRGQKLEPGKPIDVSGRKINSFPELKAAIDSVATPEMKGQIALNGFTLEAGESPPRHGQLTLNILRGKEVIGRKIGISIISNSNGVITDCTSGVGSADMANNCNVDLTCLDKIPNAVYYPRKGPKFSEPLERKRDPVCDIGFEVNNLNDQTFEILTRTGEPTEKPVQLGIEFATYTYPNNIYIHYYHLKRNRWEFLFHECNVRTEEQGWGCIHRPPESSIRHRWLKLPVGVTKLRFSFPGPSPFYLKINSGCVFTIPPLTYGDKLRLFSSWYPENPKNDDAPFFPSNKYCKPDDSAKN